jgi:membrane protein
MMIAFAGFLVIFGKTSINRLMDLGILERKMVLYMVLLLKWLVVVGLLFLAISFLYYFAPAKKADFRFISPGSTLATVLFIVTSLGFSAYVNSMGQYNKLYGWIGTLMVILVWLYLNSIALLIGFELNLCIKAAKEEDDERLRTISCNEETV